MTRQLETSRQVPSPPAPAARRAAAWLWPTAILGISVVALGMLIILLALDRAFLLIALRISIGVVIVGLFGTVALGLLWLLNRARRAAVITMQHGQPIDVRDLRVLSQATAVATLDRHYGVELARAERSAFPALSHYSVRQEGGATLAAPAPIIDHQVDLALPAPAEQVPDLPELVARGHVAGGSLLAGFNGTAPLHIDPRACGFIAVGGQSRSGKSTTVALFISQAVLMGWDVALCDPFPHKPDGLISLCCPLSGCLFRQAGTPEEIAATIQLVDQLGRRRLEGERWEKPLLLVIEEFSNIVIRGMLPADVLNVLPAMAMAYSAVGVHGIVVGHEFSRTLLGERFGATLRRSCTHRIAHRLAPDAAEFLLPSTAYARQVVELQPGRALFWGEDSPQLIHVPKVEASDLAFAARGRPPRPYAPWPAPPTVAVPPAPPPPPTTLSDRIVALLVAGGQLDSGTIAAQLNADVVQVRNALLQLTATGRIARHGTARNYSYSANTR